MSSLPVAVAPAIPLGTAGRYVAAAYVVLLAIVLLYVSIMAVRAQQLERELAALRRDVEAARAAGPDPAAAGEEGEIGPVAAGGERRRA